MCDPANDTTKTEDEAPSLPPTTGGLFVTDFDEDFGTSKIKLKRYIKTLKKGMDESEGPYLYVSRLSLQSMKKRKRFFPCLQVQTSKK